MAGSGIAIFTILVLTPWIQAAHDGSSETTTQQAATGTDSNVMTPSGSLRGIKQLGRPQVINIPQVTGGNVQQLPQQAQDALRLANSVSSGGNKQGQPKVIYLNGAQQQQQAELPQQQAAASGGNSLSDIIDKQNYYRSLHGVPALTYDPALAQSAQAWADRCVFQHSGPGENMAMAYGTMAGTDAWYNEIRMYNFAAQGYSPSTGHFTQMVWRSTQRIGCGVQPRCSGGNFLVCHYDPPGNVIGQFDNEVYPPQR